MTAFPRIQQAMKQVVRLTSSEGSEGTRHQQRMPLEPEVVEEEEDKFPPLPL